MYKSLLLPTLSILLIVLFATSCEGRKTSSNALKESVKMFKAEYALESVSYYPEDYHEIKKDTLLSNGFRIKLKTYSNMQKSIVKTTVTDNIDHITNYREFENYVVFEYGNTVVFEQHIDKAFINKHISEVLDDDFLLIGAWINEEASMFSGRANIDLQYCEINSDKCKSYNLRISKHGASEVISLNDYIL